MILLTILYVLLLLLLIAVLLFLFAAALFLFAPLTYQLRAEMKDDLLIRFRLSFLFGVVQYRYLYQNGQTESGLTALWFWMLGAKKKQTETETDSDAAEKPEVSDLIENTTEGHVKDAPDSADQTEEHTPFSQTVAAFLESARGLAQKVGAAIDFVAYILNEKELLDYTLIFARRLFRAVKVKKLNFVAEIGLDDPAATGAVAGLVYAARPFCLPWLTVQTNMTEPCFNATLSSEGRSSFRALLYPIVRYVIKKPVWHMIKKLLLHE